MPIAYFIAYIVGFGVITKLVLAQNPPKLIIWLLIIAFFVGWFVVIGMATTHDQSRSSKEAFKSGPREGIKLLKSWGAYMLGMVAISGLIYFIFVWPHS